MRLLHPAARLYAVPDARVPVKLRATDNYGLEKTALEIVPGRGRAPVEVPLVSLLDSPAAHARMANVQNPYGDGKASRRIMDALLSFQP